MSTTAAGREDRLTLELLERFEPGVFRSGKAPLYRKSTGEVETRRWVAVRGNAIDWSIYHGSVDRPILAIADEGTKVRDPETIVTLVPATDAALERYRY